MTQRERITILTCRSGVNRKWCAIDFTAPFAAAGCFRKTLGVGGRPEVPPCCPARTMISSTRRVNVEAMQVWVDTENRKSTP